MPYVAGRWISGGDFGGDSGGDSRGGQQPMPTLRLTKRTVDALAPGEKAFAGSPCTADRGFGELILGRVGLPTGLQ